MGNNGTKSGAKRRQVPYISSASSSIRGLESPKAPILLRNRKRVAPLDVDVLAHQRRAELVPLWWGDGWKQWDGDM